jgi:hypothetical protein
MTVNELIDHLQVIQSSGHGAKVVAIPDIQGATYQDAQDVKICARGLGSRREEVVLVY